MASEKEIKTEYEIKSSVDGITEILCSDYGMGLDSLRQTDPAKFDYYSNTLSLKEDDIARVATYVLIQLEQTDSKSLDNELNSISEDKDQYRALPVAKDHVVVFSEYKKVSIMDAIWFLTKFGLLSSWNPDDPKSNMKLYGQMVIDLIHFIKKAVKKLDDSEECVFARIFEMHRGGKKIFAVPDIHCGSVIPSTSGDAINSFSCESQTSDCCFRDKRNGLCKIEEDKIEKTMESLEKKGILQPLEKGSKGKWTLVT